MNALTLTQKYPRFHVRCLHSLQTKAFAGDVSSGSRSRISVVPSVAFPPAFSAIKAIGKASYKSRSFFWVILCPWIHKIPPFSKFL